MIPADLANSEPLVLLVLAALAWLGFWLTSRRLP